MTTGAPTNAIAGEVTFGIWIPGNTDTGSARWNGKAERAEADREAQEEPAVMEFVVDSGFYSRPRALSREKGACLGPRNPLRSEAALLLANSSIYRPARCFLNAAHMLNRKVENQR